MPFEICILCFFLTRVMIILVSKDAWYWLSLSNALSGFAVCKKMSHLRPDNNMVGEQKQVKTWVHLAQVVAIKQGSFDHSYTINLLI